MLWLFTGDSITQGAAHTGGARSYPQLFEEWLRFERGRPHDFVLNTAISGNFADDVLADYDRRVARFEPEVVAVMLGTNDAVRGVPGLAGYRDALDGIVGRAARDGARTIVLTPPGVMPEATSRAPHIADYARAAREAAVERRSTVVDVFADWTDRDGGTPGAWMDDAIHPNARGHREIGRLLAARVGDAIVKRLL